MYRESRVAQPSAAQVRALPKLRTSGSAFGPRRLPSFSTVMLGASPRQSKLNLACPATPKGGGNRPVVGGLRPAMLKAIGKSIDRLAQNGRTAMRGNDAAEDQAPERRRDLAQEPVEQVRRVLKEASQAAGGAKQVRQHATSARERAALAKRWELAAHARAIKWHEQAAELQERLGHPEWAAKARAHADHARELHGLALEEQREQER